MKNKENYTKPQWVLLNVRSLDIIAASDSSQLGEWDKEM